jgi:hypothetical protein
VLDSAAARDMDFLVVRERPFSDQGDWGNH